MNSTLLQILHSREDISDYLFHFTKGATAFDSLQQIITDSAIKDIKGNGYICFTESPLVLLKGMFDLFDRYNEPMYAPYGIAIKKEILFASGARHVIYGSSEERGVLPETLRWRFVEYSPNIKDFTWLREWRLNVPEFILNKDNCFLITRTKEESAIIGFDEECINDVEIEAEPADGGFEYYYSATIGRRFRCTSLEEINEFSQMSKHELEKIIQGQQFTDTTSMYLGSTWQ